MHIIDSVRGVNATLDTVLLTESAEAERLTAFFARIAAEKGFEPGDQLEAYPNSLRVALYRGEEIVGGLQVVRYEGGMMPTLTVWPELRPEFTPRSAGILLIALDRSCRGVGRYWSLIATMWPLLAKEGIDDLWAEVPVQNFGPYRRFGWPLVKMGEPRMHWGESCFPCQTRRLKAQASMKRYARIPGLTKAYDAAMKFAFGESGDG